MFDFSKISEVVTDPRDISNLTPPKKEQNGVSDEESEQGKKRKFVEITMDTPLSALSRFLEWSSAAVVTERSEGVVKPLAVVTKVDLLTWLVKRSKVE
jgi:cystathionine beta-synthase